MLIQNGWQVLHFLNKMLIFFCMHDVMEICGVLLKLKEYLAHHFLLSLEYSFLFNFTT